MKNKPKKQFIVNPNIIHIPRKYYRTIPRSIIEEMVELAGKVIEVRERRELTESDVDRHARCLSIDSLALLFPRMFSSEQLMVFEDTNGIKWINWLLLPIDENQISIY